MQRYVLQHRSIPLSRLVLVENKIALCIPVSIQKMKLLISLYHPDLLINPTKKGGRKLLCKNESDFSIKQLQFSIMFIVDSKVASGLNWRCLIHTHTLRLNNH